MNKESGRAGAPKRTAWAEGRGIPPRFVDELTKIIEESHRRTGEDWPELDPRDVWHGWPPALDSAGQGDLADRVLAVWALCGSLAEPAMQAPRSAVRGAGWRPRRWFTDGDRVQRHMWLLAIWRLDCDDGRALEQRIQRTLRIDNEEMLAELGAIQGETP